jgi:pimeloyl-ACP methyl ester carboxylesterase
MFDETTLGRRHFLRNAVLTVAATQFSAMGASRAEGNAHASFASLKQIDAGLLNIGYAESGPADGPAVFLLHGWPYDIHSYVDVAPLLAAQGYHVIVPFLRGYGSTMFLSTDTFRNAQQAVVALDVIALMDALKVKKAILGGFDWGSRTVDIIAALWPNRCAGLVSVSGYLLTTPALQQAPLPPKAELGWWYQYYFSTERGVRGYTAYTHDFNRLIWETVSPTWHFDDATFDRTADAFKNPDHVAIVIHDYRWRLGLAKGEAKYDDIERQIAELPVIAVPTITIASDFDGASKSGTAYRDKFTGKYAHRILDGIGHNVPQEAPQAFAQAIVDVANFTSS